MTERAIQREILRMCRMVFPRVFIAHVPNGAHLAGDDKQRRRQMGCLLGDGLAPGFPDLIALWGNEAGLLEVKAPGGPVQPSQMSCHALLADLGVTRVAIVRSALEAQDALLSWGAPEHGVRWRETA